MSEEGSLRIYIAGPYTAVDPENVERNVARAIDAGLHVWKLGHSPYIPHLTHFIDLRARATGVPMEYEEYLTLDLQWLRMCDALLYLGSSRGADRELAQAISMGLKIFRSIDQIPAATHRVESGCTQRRW